MLLPSLPLIHPAAPWELSLAWPRVLLPLHASDDFLAHVSRRRLVSIEVHRVRRAALRPRPQIRRVSEHLRERHPRRDDLRAASIFLALNLSAPARQVAHDVAQIVLGNDHLDTHDRLE